MIYMVKILYINCCGVNNKTKKHVVQPTKNDVEEEVVLHCCCKKCNQTIVEIRRLEYIKNINDLKINDFITSSIRLRGKTALKYLKDVVILYSIKNVNNNTLVENRWYLNCNVYGKIEKCYSNLSSLKLGLIKSEDLYK